MHPFKDAGNRDWLVVLNVAQLKAVKGRLGVDLYALAADDMKPLAELLEDPCKLVDVLYVLCEARCKELGLTDEDFGRLMAGDVLGAAADAFLAELVDFFPPRRREALRAVLAKGRAVEEILRQRGLARVAGVDPEKESERIWSEWFGASPDGSASTPGPSPSGS